MADFLFLDLMAEGLYKRLKVYYILLACFETFNGIYLTADIYLHEKSFHCTCFHCTFLNFKSKIFFQALNNNWSFQTVKGDFEIALIVFYSRNSLVNMSLFFYVRSIVIAKKRNCTFDAGQGLFSQKHFANTR